MLCEICQSIFSGSENRTHGSYWMTLKINGTWINGEVYVDKPDVTGNAEGNRNESPLYAGTLWKGKRMLRELDGLRDQFCNSHMRRRAFERFELFEATDLESLQAFEQPFGDVDKLEHEESDGKGSYTTTIR